MSRTIIFAKTKLGASNLAGHLARRGFKAVAFHSDRSQSERVRTLDSFKNGECDLLVATDIAARGLDVDDVSHVVNYDMPYSPDSYVHRIGRTARAGRKGMAITLVTSEDARGVKAIERLIDRQLPYLDEENGNGAERPHPSAGRAEEARPRRPRGGGRTGGSEGARARGRGRPEGGAERRPERRPERHPDEAPPGERKPKPSRRRRGGRKRREARERREAVPVGDGPAPARERSSRPAERANDEKSGGLRGALERLAKGLFKRR